MVSNDMHNAFILQQVVTPTGSGLLDGMSVAIKDNINMNGLPTTCASKVLEGYIAPYTATCAQSMLDAGGCVVGKTNMDEFAQGSSNENSAFGPVTNPFDRSRVPGGSSGGSAVAVAAGYSDLSLGTDTGGSIRLPAALCGIVGIKPTYGAVSRYGVQAMASSLDQVGVFGRTVTDAARGLDVVVAHDPNDATSSPHAESLRGTLLQASTETDQAKQYRIAVPKQCFSDAVDADVQVAMQSTLDALAAQGVTVDLIDLPELDRVIPLYYIMMPAEVSSNLARFDGLRFGRSKETEAFARINEYYQAVRSEGLGDEPQRRTLLGAYVLSAGYYDAYYQKAKRLQSLLRTKISTLYTEYDALCTPVSPTPAWKIGEKSDDPVAMYVMDLFTVTANIVGMPAISVPMHGSTVDEVLLPNGFQIMTNHREEAKMLRLAGLVEQIVGDRCTLYGISSGGYSVDE